MTAQNATHDPGLVTTNYSERSMSIWIIYMVLKYTQMFKNVIYMFDISWGDAKLKWGNIG